MKKSPSAVLWSLAVVAGLAVSTAPAQAAGGSAAAGKNKSAACAGCHGVDGNGGADPSWPRLAGQHADYIAKQLKDFKTGVRKDPIMAGMAAGLSDQDMRDIGAYYSGLKPGAAAARDAALVKEGERLYRGGDIKNGIAACMSCHGPSGAGIPPRFPRVSGQTTAYTVKQMKAFKDGVRKNDGDVMAPVAFRLSEQQIRALAEYMVGLH